MASASVWATRVLEPVATMPISPLVALKSSSSPPPPTEERNNNSSPHKMVAITQVETAFEKLVGICPALRGSSRLVIPPSHYVRNCWRLANEWLSQQDHKQLRARRFKATELYGMAKDKLCEARGKMVSISTRPGVLPSHETSLHEDYLRKTETIVLLAAMVSQNLIEHIMDTSYIAVQEMPPLRSPSPPLITRKRGESRPSSPLVPNKALRESQEDQPSSTNVATLVAESVLDDSPR